MSFNKPLIFVILINFLFLSLKWVLSFYAFNETILASVLMNTKDIQYYPLIVSLSEFNFSPTFLEYYNNTKIVNFPLASLVVHSIFYKFFNIYSFIILEFIFHLLLIFILFNIIKKIFNSSNAAAIFCILIFILILSLKTISNFIEPQIFNKLYDVLNENFGTRTPRPLVTGVFYFSFIYYMMVLDEKINNKLNYSYILKIAFFLGLLANSFIFLFIHSFIFFLIFVVKILNQKLIKWIKLNIKIVCYFIFTLSFFLLPLIIQILYGEVDYSSRLGLVTIGSEKKFFLIKYYLINLLRVEFLILFILTLYLNWFLNKKKNINLHTNKINIFFILVVTSIVSPLLFFIISPKIISIFHFLNIILFSFIFYIILSFFSIFYFSLKKLNLKKKYSISTIYAILTIIYISIFVPLELDFFLKNKEKRGEIIKLHKFFNKNNLNNTDLKLFTNDLLIMNLWILNNNNQLIISDAFSNSLSDTQIEFNLLNSLKDFNIGEKQLQKLISFKKSQIRNKLFMLLFNYKYQANSLYTFSKLENYHKADQDLIVVTSPFRVQMQIIPENEKKRILNLYKNLKINLDLLPNYVVINNSKGFENFSIKNDKYKEIFKTKSYLLYKRL